MRTIAEGPPRPMPQQIDTTTLPEAGFLLPELRINRRTGRLWVDETRIPISSKGKWEVILFLAENSDRDPLNQEIATVVSQADEHTGGAYPASQVVTNLRKSFRKEGIDVPIIIGLGSKKSARYHLAARVRFVDEPEDTSLQERAQAYVSLHEEQKGFFIADALKVVGRAALSRELAEKAHEFLAQRGVDMSSRYPRMSPEVFIEFCEFLGEPNPKLSVAGRAVAAERKNLLPVAPQTKLEEKSEAEQDVSAIERQEPLRELPSLVEETLFYPAHAPGHFPMEEEVARLQKLERLRNQQKEAYERQKQRRAQDPALIELRKLQNREGQRRWREKHPGVHLQRVKGWERSPQGKAYKNAWERAKRASNQSPQEKPTGGSLPKEQQIFPGKEEGSKQVLDNHKILGLAVILRAPIYMPILQRHRVAINATTLKIINDIADPIRRERQKMGAKALDLEIEVLPELFQDLLDFAAGDREAFLARNSRDACTLLALLRHLNREELVSLLHDLYNRYMSL